MEKTSIPSATAHATPADILDRAQRLPAQECGVPRLDIEAESKVDISASAPESHGRLEQLQREHGSTWSSSSDPADPYNWPSYRKIIIGTIFSFGQLIPIMSASMTAAALGDIAHDLKIGASTAQITLSSYFLGMAFAPFLIAAMSEMCGRKRVWVACNTWYILWNALCPAGNSAPLMIVGRFMTGAGASVGVTLNGPVMADMYGKSQRGRSMAIVTLLPYVGPALGPIVGGLITQFIHWSWIFWIMSLVDTAIVLLGLAFIQESYTPVLLRRKASKENSRMQSAHSTKSLYARLGPHLMRPFRILLLRPVIWPISLLAAISFAVYSLMLSTYATLWIDRYGQSELISSLHYISIALGSTIAGQIGAHIMDWLYKYLSTRAGRSGTPEFRLPYTLPGMLLMPTGLLLYGWSAEKILSWAVVDIGAIIFTLGSFVAAQGNMAYQLDEFGDYGASAGAASRMLSYTLAFMLPIFAPRLYNTLGYGWGNSTLALATLVLGVPTVAALWVWGEGLRAVGRAHQNAALAEP
ncbi:linoleoyl-CoA desaturase activity protein [Didymella keratinophila]|nr:linoleoyl-CoA desaturase activity protein [Didymella keratinophila]